MRARIKKGVRPYGGRIVDVIRTYGNTVEIEAPGTRAGSIAGQHDPRMYRRDEVDLLPDEGEPPEPNHYSTTNDAELAHQQAKAQRLK